MKTTQLKATLREVRGKHALREARLKGRVPGVLYGKGFDNVDVEVDAKELLKVIRTHGTHSLVSLRMGNGGGQDHLAMVGEVQYDVFQKVVNHVDFHKVSMSESVTTNVQVVLHGPAAGEKLGGVIDILHREIEVEGTPTNLPDKIEVDITGLEIDQSLHVGDVKLPDGVTLVTPAEDVLVIVHSPRRAEETATAEEPGIAPAGETKPQAT